MSESTTGTAAGRWADALASWAIPQEILDAAPDPAPLRLSPSKPSRKAAPCSTWAPAAAGPASRSPRPRISSSPSTPAPELLAAFREAADREGVPHRTVEGAWPDVAGQVDAADLVEAAVAVLQEMGLDVTWEESERRLAPESRPRSEVIAGARKRLCVGPERDAEIDALLGEGSVQPLRRMLTIWWDGAADGSSGG